ncbi:GNAT family N-acetyltransferase [Paracoccus cavernae]
MRVTLARPQAADTSAIALAMTDPFFSSWLSSFPFPHDRGEKDPAPDPSGVGEFAIRVDGHFAGLVIAAPEVGFWVGSPYRRKGVALRAGTLALSRYFASGAEVAYARTQLSNSAMRATLERLGFKLEGASGTVDPEQDGLLLLHRLEAADFAARRPLIISTPRCVIERVAVPSGGGLSRIVPGLALGGLLDFKAAEQARGMVAHFSGMQGASMLRISSGGRPVGLIEIGPGREPALAIWLSPEIRGRGIGTEVLPAVCTELGDRYALGSIWADVAMENRAARRLFLHSGFVAERPVMVRPLPDTREGTTNTDALRDGLGGMRFRLLLN